MLILFINQVRRWPAIRKKMEGSVFFRRAEDAEWASNPTTGPPAARRGLMT